MVHAASQVITSSAEVETPPRAGIKETGEFSGYSAEVGQTDSDSLTMASGKKVYSGAIACPSKYKFGTKIKVSEKEYICEDRMNIRYRDKNNFDIFFESYAEALNFGRRELVFEVII